MNFVIDILLIIAKVIFFPAFFLKDLILTILSFFMKDKFVAAVSSMVLFAETILLMIWLTFFIMFTMTPPFELLMDIFSTNGVLIGTETIKGDPDTYESVDGNFGGNGSGSTSGGFEFGGEEFYIDFSKLDPNIKVDLPADVWQSGTVYQRLELIYLLTEVCNRPEITVTPKYLLGKLYTESSGVINRNGSFLKTMAPVGGDGKSSGNFQITWTLDKVYVSELERSEFKGGKLLTPAEAASMGLKTPDGQSRPQREYFPDELYEAALSSSTHMEKPRSKDIESWGIKNGLNKEQGFVMRENASLAAYNGFNTGQETWIPAFYVDLMKQKGEVDQWYKKAINKKALDAFFSDTLVPSVQKDTKYWKSGIAPEHASYSEAMTYFHNRYAGTGYQESYKGYQFRVQNGGKWMYEGLGLLLSKNPGGAVSTTPPGGGGIDTGDVAPPPEAVNGAGGLKEGWMWPLPNNKRISSPYLDPTRGRHYGTDIPAPEGTAILACHDGTVIKAYTSNSWGEVLYIKNKDGTVIIYPHQIRRIAKLGQEVKMGEVVGLVGNTGDSDGNHLHLQIEVNGKHQDPMKYVTNKF